MTPSPLGPVGFPIRIGCCVPALSKGNAGLGADDPSSFEGLGLDYLELPLSQIADLNRKVFSAILSSLGSSSLRCEALKSFSPKRMRLTGREADHAAALEYSASALDRAAELGARITVFGGAAARKVPEGFPMEEAWRQLVTFTALLGELAQERGVTIAMEHLNRGESNILGSLKEAEAFVLEVDRPFVRHHGCQVK